MTYRRLLHALTLALTLTTFSTGVAMQEETLSQLLHKFDRFLDDPNPGILNIVAYERSCLDRCKQSTDEAASTEEAKNILRQLQRQNTNKKMCAKVAKAALWCVPLGCGYQSITHLYNDINYPEEALISCTIMAGLYTIANFVKQKSTLFDKIAYKYEGKIKEERRVIQALDKRLAEIRSKDPLQQSGDHPKTD